MTPSNINAPSSGVAPAAKYNPLMPVALTPRERAHLKARAHALEPKVLVGHGGATPAVIAEVDRALTAHELIKVKVLGDDREAREAINDALCAATDSASVQRVGKVLVLWRPKPDESPGGKEVKSKTSS